MNDIKIQYRITLEKNGKRIDRYRECDSISDAWKLGETLVEGYKPIYVHKKRERLCLRHKRGN